MMTSSSALKGEDCCDDIKPDATDLVLLSKERGFPLPVSESCVKVESFLIEDPVEMASSACGGESILTPLSLIEESENLRTSSCCKVEGDFEEKRGGLPCSVPYHVATKGRETISAHPHQDPGSDLGNRGKDVTTAKKKLHSLGSKSLSGVVSSLDDKQDDKKSASAIGPGGSGRKRKLQNSEQTHDKYVPNAIDIAKALLMQQAEKQAERQTGDIVDEELCDGNSAEDSNNGYLCQVCNLSFSTSRRLEDHVQTRHVDGRIESDNNNGGDFFIKPLVDQPRYKKNSSTKEKHACQECGKAFQWPSHLLKHLTIHSQEKPFQCSQCLKFFSRADHLQGHMRRHAGERPFQCDMCDKRFFDRVSLAGHCRTHTGEKPFLCGICHKGYNDMRYLKRHMRMHTGENPYECDECDKSFIDSRSLNRHKRKHAAEKPFRCNECSKSFLDSCSLVRHKKTHSGEKPYVCSDCEKCFNDIHNLKRHQRTHSGVKPWKCGDCEMRFWRKNDMQKHRQMHTGVSSSKFKCEECGAGFARKLQLQTHGKKMHSAKS